MGPMGLTIRPTPSGPPTRGITVMLLGLDRAAGMVGRPVVLVLDEFQQLSPLSPRTAPRGLEGTIRHAVERSGNVAYVFSGRQRHLPAGCSRMRSGYRLYSKITLDCSTPRRRASRSRR